MNNIVQDVIQAMTEKQAGPSSVQANFAGKISISNALINSNVKKTSCWLIDSGASDHMTAGSF